MRWFDVLRACGMIARQDGASDCAFGQIDMQGTTLRIVAEGDLVEFEVTERTGGAAAVNVVRLAEGSALPGPRSSEPLGCEA